MKYKGEKLRKEKFPSKCPYCGNTIFLNVMEIMKDVSCKDCNYIHFSMVQKSKNQVVEAITEHKEAI